MKTFDEKTLLADLKKRYANLNDKNKVANAINKAIKDKEKK